MIKISIITIHVGINFGSVLQTIATYLTLKRMGYNPLIVNYIPDRTTTKYFIKGAFKSPQKFIWRLLFLPIFLKNKNLYKRFLSKYTKLSSPIYAHHNFGKKCPKADVYITGSDQVWNSIHNQGFDGHYFFEGISQVSNIISFSSSIGRESIGVEEKIYLKKHLSSYKAVSVREDSALNILSDVGIKAVQLLDPIFLLNKNEWKTFINKRLVSHPYILIYTPYNTVSSSDIFNSAKVLAKKFNLSIVTFSWTLKRDKNADKTIRFADPGDFLSLMYYADYIITNSFHGTAFSINLNKQFWTFRPSAFSTRIESLLELTRLSDRMISRELTSEQDISYINYSNINIILDNERKRAINFLENSINKCI